MKASFRFLSFAMAMLVAPLYAELSRDENAARLRQIDRNGNGILEMDEVNLGLWYRVNPGKIDLKSPPAANDIALKAKENSIFKLLKDEFISDHSNKPSYTFDEVQADKEFRLPAVQSDAGGVAGPKQPTKATGQLMLRRSLAKMPAYLGVDSAATDMKKSAKNLADAGALFSYGRHFPTNESEIIAQGCIAYSVPFEGGLFGPMSIGQYMFSTEFSRINFTGGTKPKSASPRFQDEASALTFGFSYEALANTSKVAGGSWGSSVRFNLLGKTDFSLESKIPTAEVEWSFYRSKIGLGSFNTNNNDLWYRFDATVHADYGHVFADGSWTKSKTGDTFAHIGPKVALRLIPFPKLGIFADNPLVFDVGYSAYAKLSNQSLFVRSISIESAWYIRQPGQGGDNVGVALTLSYLNNFNVENQQNDDSLILGMAVGF